MKEVSYGCLNSHNYYHFNEPDDDRDGDDASN